MIGSKISKFSSIGLPCFKLTANPLMIAKLIYFCISNFLFGHKCQRVTVHCRCGGIYIAQHHGSQERFTMLLKEETSEESFQRDISYA